MRARWFLLVVATAVASNAIGIQHGVFRSQATQGRLWTGSSRIVNESFRITVCPDYLDVELEWVFDVGGTPPDSFRNALEIVGSFSLERGSVLVGMLLWNGDQILKAKLKPVATAREQYENVVDRNAQIPPKPRDPVIVEARGNDLYDISVFPVSWGSTRKLRMRYLVPSLIVKGWPQMGYPHAFTSLARVTVLKGQGVESFSMLKMDGSARVCSADSISLSPTETYYGSGSSRIQSLRPALLQNTQGSRLHVGSCDAPGMPGQFGHFMAATEPEILRRAPLREDVVVVWRWNHPEALRSYMKQIVQQANLLQQFLMSLNRGGRRAGLLIDIAGLEREVFGLDSVGGTGNREMAARLCDIAATRYEENVSPGPSPYTPAQADSVLRRSLREFQYALREALSQFTDTSAMKRLVVLTAGPQWITRADPVMLLDWDTTVSTSRLSDLLNGQPWFDGQLASAEQFYWPGIDLSGFLQRHAIALSVTAALTSGTDTLHVEPSLPGQTASSPASPVSGERLIYSSRPIEKEITWTIRWGGKRYATVVEKPAVLNIADGVQYARLLGASGALRLLDRPAPSSMAATLGFVDQRYALLALEEDVVPDTVASRYRLCGVPALDWSDIVSGEPQQRTTYTSENPSATPVAQAPERNRTQPFDVSIQHGVLRITLGARMNMGEPVTIALYTVSGRLLYTWKLRSAYVLSLSLPPALRIARGSAVVVHLRSGQLSETRMVTAR